jgi:hypothetical protein
MAGGKGPAFPRGWRALVAPCVLAVAAASGHRATGQPRTPPSAEDSDVAEFSQFAEPLLLNRCSAPTCHGRASHNGFRLVPTMRRNLRSRRTISQNLAATLAHVDHQRPATSPLLIMAQRAHGGASDPALQKDSELFRRFEAWVVGTAQRPTPQTEDNDRAEAAPSRSASCPNDPAADNRADPFDPAPFNDAPR